MEQENIKISVIVPMFNVEEYIKETIESLIAQDLRNIEIILIDDCSTDLTYNIASFFKNHHEHIVLIKQPENKGVSAARNLGIDKARGEFIFFIDGDDTLPQGTLRLMYNTAIEKNADLITGIYRRFGNMVNTISNFFYKFPELQLEGYKSLIECPSLLYSVYACGKLFRKELVTEMRFLENLRYGEDQVFTINCLIRSSRIYNLSNVVYNYRVREGESGSLSQTIYKDPSKNLQYLFEMISIVEHTFKDYIADETIRNELFSVYFTRVIHWNIWTALSSGILSDRVFIRLEILNKYKKWISCVPDSLFTTNKEDFDLVHLKLSKIFDVLDNASKKSCLALFELIKQKGIS